MQRVTITHTDGRQVTIPKQYARNIKTQRGIDTVVDDAHNRHPIAVATTRALKVEKV